MIYKTQDFKVVFVTERPDRRKLYAVMDRSSGELVTDPALWKETLSARRAYVANLAIHPNKRL